MTKRTMNNSNNSTNTITKEASVIKRETPKEYRKRIAQETTTIVEQPWKTAVPTEERAKDFELFFSYFGDLHTYIETGNINPRTLEMEMIVIPKITDDELWDLWKEFRTKYYDVVDKYVNTTIKMRKGYELSREEEPEMLSIVKQESFTIRMYNKDFEASCSKVRADMRYTSQWLVDNDMEDREILTEKEVMANHLGKENLSWDDYHAYTSTYGEQLVHIYTKCQYEEIYAKAEAELLSNKVNRREPTWEEDLAFTYLKLKYERESRGENIDLYWRRAKSQSVDASDNTDAEADHGPAEIASDNAIEEDGALESCVKLFNKGINTGDQMKFAYKNSYFEQGINPNDVYHVEFDVIAPWDAYYGLKNRADYYCKDLVAKMLQTEKLRAKREEQCIPNLPEWLKVTKYRIRRAVWKCKDRLQTRTVTPYNILSNLISKKTDGVFRMPYDTCKVFEFRSGITAEQLDLATKALQWKAKDKDIREDLLPIVMMFKNYKSENSKLISELFDYRKECANDKFDGREKKVFKKVQAKVAEALKLSKDKVGSAIALMETFMEAKPAPFTRKEAMTAYYYARRHKAFSKKEFVVFMRSKLIKVPVAKNKAKAKEKVREEIVKIIRQLQQPNPKLGLVTEANAAEILKGCGSCQDYRIKNSKVYNYVKAMRPATPKAVNSAPSVR